MALARIVAQGVKRQQPLRVPVKEPQIELAARSNLLKERQLIAMYVNHIWAEILLIYGSGPMVLCRHYH